MTTLGDVLRVKHGFAFSGDLFSDDPSLPTIVTPANFRIGGGFQGARVKTYSGQVPPEFALAPGALIITMTDLSKATDTLGSPAVVPDDGLYLHNQRIGLVEITKPDLAHVGFLHYRLRLPDYRSYIVGSASGTTVRHTSPGRIETFPIELPDIRQQQAIAEVLGALDDKIAANTALSHAASALAQSLFARASSGVARVPASSVLVPLLGGTPDRARTELWIGEVPWVSARDIAGASEGIILQTEESISAEAVARSRAKPVPAGSVILTARGTVGAVARLGIAAAFNQSCYAFVPSPSLPAACLFFMVKDAAIEALSVAHGSVFSTITMRSFDALTVPDLDTAAIGVLDDELGPLLDLVAAKATESRHLAQLRDTLLPHLMSGRITVRQAESLVDAPG